MPRPVHHSPFLTLLAPTFTEPHTGALGVVNSTSNFFSSSIFSWTRKLYNFVPILSVIAKIRRNLSLNWLNEISTKLLPDSVYITSSSLMLPYICLWPSPFAVNRICVSSIYLSAVLDKVIASATYFSFAGRAFPSTIMMTSMKTIPSRDRVNQILWASLWAHLVSGFDDSSCQVQQVRKAMQALVLVQVKLLLDRWALSQAQVVPLSGHIPRITLTVAFTAQVRESCAWFLSIFASGIQKMGGVGQYVEKDSIWCAFGRADVCAGDPRMFIVLFTWRDIIIVKSRI